MNDLISMEQLVTELEIEIGETYNDDIIKGIRRAIEIVEQRPTVEPVRGEWIPDERGTHFCSVCDSEAYWDTDYGQELFYWCPYCGADMRGEKND